jgi:hypothetical protein
MNTRYVLSILLSGASFLGLSAQDGKNLKADVKTSKKEVKVSESGVAAHQERFYFPMIVTKDISYSSNLFADAATRFYATHETRQKYLAWFNETYPEIGKYLGMEKSAIPGTEVAITIYKVNSRFIKAIIEDSAFVDKKGFPTIIDSLMLRDAFLGGDLAADINTRKTTQAEKDAIEIKRLSASVKPSLDRQSAKSTDGHLARDGKDIKEAFLAKARFRDAIFIDQATQAPVFIEADLLAEGVGEVDYRIYEFAFRWMIFANAYPDLYHNISSKVKQYIYNGDWYGLYTFSRENLNPSSFSQEIDYILNSNNL